MARVCREHERLEEGCPRCEPTRRSFARHSDSHLQSILVRLRWLNEQHEHAPTETRTKIPHSAAHLQAAEENNADIAALASFLEAYLQDRLQQAVARGKEQASVPEPIEATADMPTATIPA
jgi:hypothetical protein